MVDSLHSLKLVVYINDNNDPSGYIKWNPSGIAANSRNACGVEFFTTLTCTSSAL